MSADKHKKRDRAYAFMRGLGKFDYGKLWGHPKTGTYGPRERTFSGSPTAIMRYCVERGMATIRRDRRHGVVRRNVFSAEDEGGW